MGKFTRACLAALVALCVALPVLSAGGPEAPKATTANSQQQRLDQLGSELRRARAEKQQARPEKQQQPGGLVAVEVSTAVEQSPVFKELMAELPHALVKNEATAKSAPNTQLLLETGDVDRLRASIAAEQKASHDATATERLAELAHSLKAVRNARVDLGVGRISYDAAQNETPAEAPAYDSETTMPQAPESVVQGAAPAANPSEPAPEPADAPAEAPAEEATPAEGDLPAPPEKRIEGAEPATESNAEITTKIRELEAQGENAKTAIEEAGISSANGSAKPKLAPGSKITPTTSTSAPAPAPKAYTGDPLEQRINLDFREMELSNVVALLASKAGINVIAGTDLSGTVTANLKNVPLRQAIETSLRMNGLGMLEEEGIYRIVTYDEAINAKRASQIVPLTNAKADELAKVLSDIVKGSPDERRINISPNQSANVLVISGPQNRVPELVAMANQLDIAKPVLPTLTEAIKLNYAEPKDVLPTVTAMLSKDVGKVATDERARHLIVTDLPVVLENVREMVKTLDLPTKQVAIDSMIVDATLTDDAETGVDWLASLVRRQSRREAALGDSGRFVSDLQNLSFESNMPGAAEASTLTFGLLTGTINWTAAIKAEINNTNGRLVSNPSIITVENKPAMITIAEEIPYIELIQTAAGGQQNKTSFKEVGTILEVTPRVTHDNNILAQVSAKESNTTGSFNNVPIENKRELTTSLRLANGQTVFMGGLRKNADDITVRKIPVLGDIPVVNYLFRNNKKTDRKNELMLFLTCHVLDADKKELTPAQQDKYDTAHDPVMEVNAGNELLEYTVHPGELRDPVWKYRRTTK